MSSETAPAGDADNIPVQSDTIEFERDRLVELQSSTQELIAAAEQISDSSEEVNGVANDLYGRYVA